VISCYFFRSVWWSWKDFYIFSYWCGKLVAFFLLSNRSFAAGFFI